MNTNKKIVKSVLNKTPNVERFFQLSIAVLLYVFTLFLVFPTYIQKVNIPNVGDIVTEPFIVKQNVRYENKGETEKLLYYTEAAIAPVFDMPKNIEYEALSKISNMFSFMRISHDNNIPIDEIYNQFLLMYDEPINKSVFSNAVVNDLNIGYEAKIIETIKELFGVGILSRGNLSADTLSLILNNGIFVYSYDNYIIEEKLLPRNRVFFLEDLRAELPSMIGTKYRNLNINHINSISSIINAFLKDNLIYNSSKTKEKVNTIKYNVDPVYNLIKKGFPILTVGERVTEEKAENISSMFSSTSDKEFDEINEQNLPLGVPQASIISLKDDSINITLVDHNPVELDPEVDNIDDVKIVIPSEDRNGDWDKIEEIFDDSLKNSVNNNLSSDNNIEQPSSDELYIDDNFNNVAEIENDALLDGENVAAPQSSDYQDYQSENSVSNDYTAPVNPQTDYVDYNDDAQPITVENKEPEQVYSFFKNKVALRQYEEQKNNGQRNYYSFYKVPESNGNQVRKVMLNKKAKMFAYRRKIDKRLLEMRSSNK